MADVRTYRGYYTSLDGVTSLKTCTYIATGIPRGTQEDKDKALELLAQGMMQKDVVKETGLSTYMVRKLKLLMSK
jgi:hypothetical protein